MLISCSSHKRFFPDETVQVLIIYGNKKKHRKATCTRCEIMIKNEVAKELNREKGSLNR